MKHWKWMGPLLIGALVPAVSQAQAAYVSKNSNLRAGPASQYPVVVHLRKGVSINVQACLSDYTWCDVVAGPYRGWIYAANVVYPYQGQRAPLNTVGAVIGIAAVTFIAASYWDDHYRTRPWYRDRQYWIEHPHPHPRHNHRTADPIPMPGVVEPIRPYTPTPNVRPLPPRHTSEERQ